MCQSISAQSVDIDVKVGGQTFRATVEESETGKTFASMLPATLQMEELNGNEKYCYVEQSLPTSPSNPGTIHAGDIMLYGARCVVVFYETFPTSYSYTRIGRIADVEGLKEALGSGDVSVSFAVSRATGVRSVRAESDAPETYSLSGAKVRKGHEGLVVEGGRLKFNKKQ